MRARSRRRAARCASPAGALRERDRDHRRRRRAGHAAATRSRRSSSASTPTGRIRASARTPASACRSPSRSSRPMAAPSGPRTAPVRRTPTATPQRARRALRRAPAGDVMAQSRDGSHPRLRGAGRRARGADPRAGGRRQVAAGAGAHRGGAQPGLLRFARLVGDDRVHRRAAGGRLLVRPAPALAGLIEVRGLGIRRLAHEPVRGGRARGRPRGRRRRTAAGGRAATRGRSTASSLPRLAVAAGDAGLAGVLALPHFEVAASARRLTLAAGIGIEPFGQRSDRVWLEIGNLNAAYTRPRFARRRCHDRTMPIRRSSYRNATTPRNQPRMPLALGLWMVMMSALSCGATGTRPRGVP